MQQCQIQNDSLRFSRAVYAVMVLAAVLIHSQWLVLAVAVLTILGAFSLNLNIFYQLHFWIKKNIFKKEIISVMKDSGELSFVSGMTGILLLAGFLWLYSGQSSDLAWVYVLIVDFLIFLACLVGFCVATLMYVILKKIFKK
jgi:hypothetical protein